SLTKHPAVGRKPIVQRGRKAMFRRKTIIDCEHAAAADERDLRNQVAMRGHRADTKAAAMEIENGLILWRIGGRYPLALDATGGDAFARDRSRAATVGRIPIPSHLCYCCIVVPSTVD